MNEKLIELAKEAGFDSSLGEITVIHMNRHINVTNKVNKLIELAACTLPDNTELLSAAKAIIAGWDNKEWKDLPHTGEAIDRLRKAIEGIK